MGKRLDFTEEDIQTMARLYNEGVSSTLIATAFGCHGTTILRVFRENDIELKPIGWANGSGPNSRAWRGGRTNTGIEGYINAWVPDDDPLAVMKMGSDNYVLEHRLVMARHLGRPLNKDESVHHKNGDRADNRIENLELWSKAQPAGQRIEEKLSWALELVGLYGNEVAYHGEF